MLSQLRSRWSENVTQSILPGKLIAVLTNFASKKKLLVCLDFDGTLAPLVDDPEASRMIDCARQALERLTLLPGVSVALVTGRSIESIKRVADPLDEWFLVGSHGIEVLSPGELTSYETQWLVSAELTEAFYQIVSDHPGVRLERKPFGLALHTRGVEEQVARDAELVAHQLVDSWGTDLVVRTGHGIVECSIQEATKGDGIEEVRRRLGSTAVLFAGDDRTDEDGFAVLGAQDVGIRVGEGETIAPYRLPDADAVAEALWFIYYRRAQMESGS
jgi:trehalose-phosphatase